MASVTQLRAFHFVATAGGYSQAAREMSVSQSTLSGQVRQLEAISGVVLFERGPRGATLTADGEALFLVTARLFTALSEAGRMLKSRKAEGGRLRLASDGTVHSLPILGALRRRRPKLVGRRSPLAGAADGSLWAASAFFALARISSSSLRVTSDCTG